MPVHAFQIPLALELPTEQGQGLQHVPGWLRIKFFAVDSLRCSTSLCRGFCLVRAFNVAVGHPIISCLSPSSPTSTYAPFNTLQLVYVHSPTQLCFLLHSQVLGFSRDVPRLCLCLAQALTLSAHHANIGGRTWPAALARVSLALLCVCSGVFLFICSSRVDVSEGGKGGPEWGLAA